MVPCRSLTTRGMRVPFKVTSCTSHSDINQPTYLQLLEEAWILRPGSRRRPAGFVKHRDLREEEAQAIMVELQEQMSIRPPRATRSGTS